MGFFICPNRDIKDKPPNPWVIFSCQVSHDRVGCQSVMPGLAVSWSCPGWLSVSHARASCQLVMPGLAVSLSCPGLLSVSHVRVGCQLVMTGLAVHQS